MISRAACAPRICLSCRLGLVQRRAAVGARPLPPRRHDLGLRVRHASDSTAVQNKDLVEALISGKVSLEERAKAAKRKQAREKRRRPYKVDDEPEWGGEDAGEVSAEVKEPARRQKIYIPPRDPNAKIRSAAASDEPFPGDQLSWRKPERQVKVGAATSTDKASPVQEEPEEAPEAPEVHYSSNEAFANPVPSESDMAPGGAYITPGEYRPFEHRLLKQQPLTIEALGKKVGALIIKNPDELGRRRRTTSFADLAKTPPQEVDWLDWKKLLPTEEPEIDGADEATKYIEELRPTDSFALPRVDFYKLRQTLVDSFTGEQLAVYYRQGKRDKIEAPPAASETPSYSWLAKQRSWKPADREKPDASSSSSTKSRLARMIMQTQWELRIQEEAESPGLAAAYLQRDIFQLFAQPQTGALDILAADVLDETIGEAITPNPASHSLEFYARKTSIPLLLQRMDELLQSVVTRSVSVEDINIGSLQKDVLDELSRLTGTVIQHDKTAQQLKISRITEGDLPRSKGGEGGILMEDAADIVLRLLRGRPTQHLDTEEQVVGRRIRSQSGLSKIGGLIPYTRESRSMAWEDRLKPWSRFAHPIGVRGEFKKRWLKYAEKVQIPGPEPDFFKEKAQNRLVATFGHILLSKPEGKGSKSTKQRRRILVPVVPHPASLTEFLPEKDEDLTKRSCIILNFTPAPGTDSADGPEVRLTLPIAPDSDFSNFSMPDGSKLHAVVPWFAKDTLVPEDFVDVRIVQQREVPLDMSRQAPLREFFAASEFNLAEGRLRTPSSTQFSMPRRWVDKTTESGDVVDTQYMFAGLEIHQTVEMLWKGHILRYNSIEAGQHGGTRQELSVVGKISGKNTELAAEQRLNFLNLIELAVEGKCWSWTNGAAQVRELPDEDDQFWVRSIGGATEEPEVDLDSRSEQEDLDVAWRDDARPAAKKSSKETRQLREREGSPINAIEEPDLDSWPSPDDSDDIPWADSKPAAKKSTKQATNPHDGEVTLREPSSSAPEETAAIMPWPWEKGAVTEEDSALEKLAPGPRAPIDVAHECDEALGAGGQLAADIEDALHEDSAFGKETKDVLEAGQSLAQDVEDALHMALLYAEDVEELIPTTKTPAESGPQDIIEEVDDAVIDREAEEVLEAGKILGREVEERLRARGDTAAHVQEDTNQGEGG